MLKTSGSIESKTWSGEGGVGVGGSSRAGRNRSGNRMDEGEVDSGEIEDDEIGKKVQKLSKSKKMVGSDILTPGAKLAFTKLRQAFVKAPILHHIDLEWHIRIKMDAQGYVISKVLSQLTSYDSGWWHPMAFFLRKMILPKTRYETHDTELLAIVETFKTWRHYLKSSRHEVLILTNHNNLQ